MKRFLLLIATAISFSSVTASFGWSSEENENLNVIQPYAWESIINETLTNLSISLQEYDPHYIEEVGYKINSTEVSGDINAKQILISGFAGFSATNIQNNITLLPPGLKSTFNVKFEELKVTLTEYSVNGMALFVPFYGTGYVTLIAKQINGGADARIATSISGKMKLKSLEIKLNISQTDLDVTGILNNQPLSQIVSTSMTECFSEFVNLYNDRLGKLLGAKLIEPINNILHPPKQMSELDSLEEDDEFDEDDYSEESLSEEEESIIKVGRYSFKIKLPV